MPSAVAVLPCWGFADPETQVKTAQAGNAPFNRTDKPDPILPFQAGFQRTLSTEVFALRATSKASEPNRMR